MNNPFQNGAAWLRADFHLHTKADKEFSYTGDENYYYSNYVAALEKAGIRIGVITNHNKFDKTEFEDLRKTARKKNIFLLPGIELSVNDGANGIHTLVVFSDEWCQNNHDYINQFLNVAFEGKTPDQYENENSRSSINLIETIKKLENYHKDFFLIFAHVEQTSGLWNELDGGRLEELGKNKCFRRRTLGFQKVRTHDKTDKKCRVKVKSWLQDAYPAEVEGSDAKSIETIGQGEACYLKLSAFSFAAVKFALTDYRNRVAKEIPKYTHSYIKNISFQGGVLAGKTIDFSPELNTLIGIRGSGKSSVLEVLRYALDISFGDKAGDRHYKQELVAYIMGNGGKVVIQAIDRYGQPYEIHRVFKENHSTVYIDGILQPGVSLQKTVLHKPIYFGQKDLSSTGEGFERDLVDKLLGQQLDEIRRQIAAQKAKVVTAVEQFKKLTDLAQQIEEHTKIKQDTEHCLKRYADYGIEERLQKRLDFEADIRALHEAKTRVDEFTLRIKEVLANYEDEMRDVIGYESKHNADLVQAFMLDYATIIHSLEQIKTETGEIEKNTLKLAEKHTQLVAIRQGLVDEFANIERTLAAELKANGVQNINSDEFLRLKQKLTQTTQLLNSLIKQNEQRDSAVSELTTALDTLNQLWHQEFILIKKELDKIRDKSPALLIESRYKADKANFLTFMKENFKGSNIRETSFQKLVDKYQDFMAIHTDFANAKTLITSSEVFSDYFEKNLTSLLTYQTPNQFVITYHGKELQHHSLGQRASALILFILSQQDNDVIIIDQPEDDLDNQTLYQDVIKLLRQMKPNVQFIFATHNPNIPVLGDAEQIHACTFTNECISIQSGGIDESAQQKAVVEIMEGGNEAFNRRKEIYQIWTS